jgi:sterol desaturase/sphingolipid hydroxylase (fatty acid hydroxylase superfamily)
MARAPSRFDAAIDWLFRRTRPEYYADFFITPPLTALFACLSLRHGFNLSWIVAFAVGWAVWSFYEYALHRWGLHEAPLLRDVHRLHHRNQRDYLAFHPGATLAAYAALWLVFGVHSSAVMVGFSTGYIVYAALHTAFHYARIGEGHPLYRARMRHVAHHRFDDVCYGVTTGFWDRLFRTEFRPSK